MSPNPAVHSVGGKGAQPAQSARIRVPVATRWAERTAGVWLPDQFSIEFETRSKTGTTRNPRLWTTIRVLVDDPGMWSGATSYESASDIPRAVSVSVDTVYHEVLRDRLREIEIVDSLLRACDQLAERSEELMAMQDEASTRLSANREEMLGQLRQLVSPAQSLSDIPEGALDSWIHDWRTKDRGIVIPLETKPLGPNGRAVRQLRRAPHVGYDLGLVLRYRNQGGKRGTQYAADKLGVSRTYVSKLLRDARALERRGKLR